MTDSLAERLGVGRSELVAFVGAGGKSSLLLGLGAELVTARHRVVLTTTTRMAADQIPSWATVCRKTDDLVKVLDGGETGFLVGELSDEKVIGVGPDLVDRVFELADVDHVLVEADGARGRWLKVPAPHEPMIPAATTLVVAVASMDAIGRTIGEATHRPELVAALLDLTVDDPLGPAEIARTLSHPEGGRSGVPTGARVTVALTKVASEAAAAAAEQVADLLQGAEIDRVITIDSLPSASIGIDSAQRGFKS